MSSTIPDESDLEIAPCLGEIMLFLPLKTSVALRGLLQPQFPSLALGPSSVYSNLIPLFPPQQNALNLFS